MCASILKELDQQDPVSCCTLRHLWGHALPLNLSTKGITQQEWSNSFVSSIIEECHFAYYTSRYHAHSCFKKSRKM